MGNFKIPRRSSSDNDTKKVFFYKIMSTLLSRSLKTEIDF